MTPALALYQAHLVARGLRPNTIRAYVQWVQRLPGDPLTMTAEDIEGWIAGHREVGQTLRATPLNVTPR
jgi:hypothetical protein